MMWVLGESNEKLGLGFEFVQDRRSRRDAPPGGSKELVGVAQKSREEQWKNSGEQQSSAMNNEGEQSRAEQDKPGEGQINQQRAAESKINQKRAAESKIRQKRAAESKISRKRAR